MLTESLEQKQNCYKKGKITSDSHSFHVIGKWQKVSRYIYSKYNMYMYRQIQKYLA